MRRPRSRSSPYADELFRHLVDSVTDYSVILLDREGLVASWNQGAERIKGYKAREILGRHFSVFYTPEDRKSKKFLRLLELAQRQGRVADEGWRLRKDGSRFWASVVITALRNSRGTLIGFAKITRDLTERRAHEEAISRAKTELEEAVDFLAQDIGDTLAHLSTFGQMLEERPLEDDERKLVGYIVDNVARLRALVAGMLEFRGSPSARAGFAPTSLSGVISEAARQLKEDLHVDAGRIWAEDLPTVYGDAGLLTRLFRHLLGTMAAVAPKGEAREVRVHAAAKGGEWILRLSNGPAKGEPPSGDEPRASSRDLAVVMKIAAMHGGRVWAKTSPNPGGEFFVALPAKKPRSSRRASAAA